VDDRLTCPHTALSRYAFIQVLCFGSALSTACRDGNDRVADVYVSHCHLCKSLSREKTILLTRATEERANTNTFRTHSSQLVPLGVGSCLRRTGHLFAVSDPEGLHRRLSLCSLPVPKQFKGASGV